MLAKGRKNAKSFAGKLRSHRLSAIRNIQVRLKTVGAELAREGALKNAKSFAGKLRSHRLSAIRNIQVRFKTVGAELAREGARKNAKSFAGKHRSHSEGVSFNNPFP
ncbi:hypothetical protein QNM99_01415 [Pseudomonas sp. PCH446]